MKEEFSYGAVVFCRRDGELYFVLVQESDGHWSFPKGHIEKGEDGVECALREIWEETGVHVTLDTGFEKTLVYPKAGGVMKHTTLYISEIEYGIPLVKADDCRSIAVLSYEEAKEKLDNEARIKTLDEACHYIKRKAI